MAKKWTPSQKQLSAYDELLKKQNRTRRRLLRQRRIIEEEGGSARGLPDLIIPKKARRSRNLNYRFDSYKQYIENMRALRREFGKEDISYIKEHYFLSYKEILNEFITRALEEGGYPFKNYRSADDPLHTKLEGVGGNFSKEQIESVREWRGGVLSKVADAMELFNLVNRRGVNAFSPMYTTGYIPALHFIYDELNNKHDYSILDDFRQQFRDFDRAFARNDVMITALVNYQNKTHMNRSDSAKRVWSKRKAK